MALIDVKAPSVGESITEVVIGEWLKQPGDWVEEDESVVVVESDKVNMEVPAPKAGVLGKALFEEGDTVTVGTVVTHIDSEAQAPKASSTGEPAASSALTDSASTSSASTSSASAQAHVMPAAARILAEKGLSAEGLKGSGPGGRILKEDAMNLQVPSVPKPAAKPAAVSTAPKSVAGSREVESVKMSPMRRTIAKRLLEAQQNAAILSTFNEVDMSGIMAIRKRYKEAFINKHGIKLGFMSFFVKAVCEALKQYPAVNAQIEGKQVIYHHYCDIGVAVGGGKGLVVPVIRNAEALGFAEVEGTITDFGRRAKDNKIKLEELQGGTFTITNGGVYGSLLSTPIINPPQSGILGMHGIQERPIALNGEVVIRPMMYIALSYDHRIVDGREAVSFLKMVKELCEDPQRILLEI
ncbi:MAG: dihydrolipoyllysine-residue succinyltransferase [Myxococcales bacterium]|nr:dihydrolipoyllysine-residue succinyltransferase [Myxococcales bacterium]